MSVGQPVVKAGHMVRWMRLIPTVKGQACERVGALRLPRVAFSFSLFLSFSLWDLYHVQRWKHKVGFFTTEEYSGTHRWRDGLAREMVG